MKNCIENLQFSFNVQFVIHDAHPSVTSIYGFIYDFIMLSISFKSFTYTYCSYTIYRMLKKESPYFEWIVVFLIKIYKKTENSIEYFVQFISSYCNVQFFMNPFQRNLNHLCERIERLQNRQKATFSCLTFHSSSVSELSKASVHIYNISSHFNNLTFFKEKTKTDEIYWERFVSYNLIQVWTFWSGFYCNR